MFQNIVTTGIVTNITNEIYETVTKIKMKIYHTFHAN